MSFPLVFDDVEVAGQRLSPLGQAVVMPASRTVRSTIAMLAAVRGWRGCSYHHYAQWAIEPRDGVDMWVSLDPLLLVDDLANTYVVRCSRSTGAGGWELDAALPEAVSVGGRGRRVGVIDDVVYSGQTLCHVSRLIAASGGRVTYFVVGSCRESGRQSVATEFPEARWSMFLDGDFDAIHLRDVCPCLPHAGRPVSDWPPVDTALGAVRFSAPPTEFRGGPWGDLTTNANLRHSLAVARREVVRRFGEVLGRPATIADIPLLGASVSVSTTKLALVDPTSRLDAIML